MKCPYCPCKETQVIETRETTEELTRRRRECLKCKKRFTTYERADSAHLRVAKRDGNREMFDREKLKRGLLKACEKRPVKSEQIEAVVEEIEKKLRAKGKREVSTSEIGSLVMAKLKKLDAVAYIRFASVYMKFEGANDFKKALNQLKK